MQLNIKLGAFLSILSALAYAIQSAIIKGHFAALPLPPLVFIQSLWSFFLLSCILLVTRKKTEVISTIKTKNLKLQIFRAIFSLGISYLLFYALKFIPLVDGVLLANTAPLMVPFLGLLLFKQKINHHLWLPLLLGFIGVALVLKPGAELFQPAAILALGAGLCMANSMLAVRKLSDVDSTSTSVFYYFFLASIISGIASLFYLPDFAKLNIPLALLVATLFFLVQYTLTLALHYANAQTVSVTYYSCVIFAAMLGWIFFSAKFDWIIISGIVLICGSGIACIKIQANNKEKQTNPFPLAGES